MADANTKVKKEYVTKEYALEKVIEYAKAQNKEGADMTQWVMEKAALCPDSISKEYGFSEVDFYRKAYYVLRVSEGVLDTDSTHEFKKAAAPLTDAEKAQRKAKADSKAIHLDSSEQSIKTKILQTNKAALMEASEKTSVVKLIKKYQPVGVRVLDSKNASFTVPVEDRVKKIAAMDKDKKNLDEETKVAFDTLYKQVAAGEAIPADVEGKSGGFVGAQIRTPDGNEVIMSRNQITSYLELDCFGYINRNNMSELGFKLREVKAKAKVDGTTQDIKKIVCTLTNSKVNKDDTFTEYAYLIDPSDTSGSVAVHSVEKYKIFATNATTGAREFNKDGSPKKRVRRVTGKTAAYGAKENDQFFSPEFRTQKKSSKSAGGAKSIISDKEIEKLLNLKARGINKLKEAYAAPKLNDVIDPEIQKKLMAFSNSAPAEAKENF